MRGQTRNALISSALAGALIGYLTAANCFSSSQASSADGHLAAEKSTQPANLVGTNGGAANTLSAVMESAAICSADDCGCLTEGGRSLILSDGTAPLSPTSTGALAPAQTNPSAAPTASPSTAAP